MALNIKGSTVKGKSKGEVNLSGLMKVISMETLTKIIFMEQEFIVGMMEGCILETENLIKWMGFFLKKKLFNYYFLEKENLFGMISENIKEIILMIKNMGMANLNGRMEGFIKGNGKMANSMDSYKEIFIYFCFRGLYIGTN